MPGGYYILNVLCPNIVYRFLPPLLELLELLELLDEEELPLLLLVPVLLLVPTLLLEEEDLLLLPTLVPVEVLREELLPTLEEDPVVPVGLLVVVGVRTELLPCEPDD